MEVGNQLQSSSQTLRIRIAVLAILILGLLVRLLLALSASWPGFSDSRDYHALAKNLLEGAGYFQRYHGENPIHEGYTFYAYRMPGYPIFLAVIYGLFGFAARNAYLAQAVIEVFGLYLFWRMAKEIVPVRAAIIALAFLSANIFWSGLLTTEVLFNTLILALVVWLVCRNKAPSHIQIALVGVIVACAVFVRPVALLIVPILIWRLPWSQKALLLLPLVAVITVWGVRNEGILGAPVLLSTNSGWHNAPRFGVDRREIFTRLRAEKKNETEINRALSDKIVELVIAEPAFGVWVFFQRFTQMFSLSPPHEIEQFVFKRTFGAGISKALRIYWLQFWFVYPLAAAGAIAFWHNKQLRTFTVLTLCTVSLHGLMSDGSFRFFAPWYFVLCLFAGAATDLMIRRWPSLSKPS